MPIVSLLDYIPKGDDENLLKMLKVFQQIYQSFFTLVESKDFLDWYKETFPERGNNFEQAFVDVITPPAGSTYKQTSSHNYARCFTTTKIMNYFFFPTDETPIPSLKRQDSFSNLSKSSLKSQQLKEDIQVKKYRMNGSGFPDHVFITIKIGEYLIIIQSFYHVYTIAGYYGILILSDDDLYLFERIMDTYKLLSDNVLEISDTDLKSLNDVYNKNFTGVKSDWHTSYMNQQILQSLSTSQYKKYFSVEETVLPLSLYLSNFCTKMSDIFKYFAEKIDFENSQDLFAVNGLEEYQVINNYLLYNAFYSEYLIDYKNYDQVKKMTGFRNILFIYNVFYDKFFTIPTQVYSIQYLNIIEFPIFITGLLYIYNISGCSDILSKKYGKLLEKYQGRIMNRLLYTEMDKLSDIVVKKMTTQLRMGTNLTKQKLAFIFSDIERAEKDKFDLEPSQQFEYYLSKSKKEKEPPFIFSPLSVIEEKRPIIFKGYKPSNIVYVQNVNDRWDFVKKYKKNCEISELNIYNYTLYIRYISCLLNKYWEKSFKKSIKVKESYPSFIIDTKLKNFEFKKTLYEDIKESPYEQVKHHSFSIEYKDIPCEDVLHSIFVTYFLYGKIIDIINRGISCFSYIYDFYLCDEDKFIGYKNGKLCGDKDIKDITLIDNPCGINNYFYTVVDSYPESLLYQIQNNNQKVIDNILPCLLNLFLSFYTLRDIHYHNNNLYCFNLVFSEELNYSFQFDYFDYNTNQTETIHLPSRYHYIARDQSYATFLDYPNEENERILWTSSSTNYPVDAYDIYSILIDLLITFHFNHPQLMNLLKSLFGEEIENFVKVYNIVYSSYNIDYIGLRNLDVYILHIQNLLVDSKERQTLKDKIYEDVTYGRISFLLMKELDIIS